MFLLRFVIERPMIHRRTLLLGTAGLVASSLLTGCNRNTADTLKVTLLEGAVPPEVLQAFQKQISTPVNFQTQAQVQDVFQQLQRWQQPPEDKSAAWSRFLPWRETEAESAARGLVSLGDYWLKSAIAQDLIQPLAFPDESLAPLPIQWQQFVSRDKQGQIGEAQPLWAAPYKVQALVIVYRQIADEQPIESWRDLLAPSLTNRIALPDHPNLVIGLLQKLQTGSFNPSFDDLASSSAATSPLVDQLKEALAEPFALLNRQVKTYDAATALKALVNEDVQAVVAWSGDVVTALQRYRSLRAVVPAEGSLLSADMWVQPKGATMSESAQAWIDFCWQPGPATQISVSDKGLSPIFLTEEALQSDAGFPPALAESRLSTVAMRNSEPLLPLPDAVQSAYLSLWEQLRSQAA